MRTAAVDHSAHRWCAVETQLHTVPRWLFLPCICLCCLTTLKGVLVYKSLLMDKSLIWTQISRKIYSSWLFYQDSCIESNNPCPHRSDKIIWNDGRSFEDTSCYYLLLKLNIMLFLATIYDLYSVLGVALPHFRYILSLRKYQFILATKISRRLFYHQHSLIVLWYPQQCVLASTLCGSSEHVASF